MKNIVKTLIITLSSALVLTSCVKEDDYVIPEMREPFFAERFEDVTNNTNLDLAGWTNFAEEGTWVWRERIFDDNGYAEFSAYNSGAASNVVWLITPQIDASLYQNPKLTFKCAQHHLDFDDPENSLEVLYSTDFDGTDVLAATWTSLDGLNLPTSEADWYAFFRSDVAVPSIENLHIAFKFRGSGTNTDYDGAFQVDDVFVYNQN